MPHKGITCGLHPLQRAAGGQQAPRPNALQDGRRPEESMATDTRTLILPEMIQASFHQLQPFVRSILSPAALQELSPTMRRPVNSLALQTLSLCLTWLFRQLRQDKMGRKNTIPTAKTAHAELHVSKPKFIGLWKCCVSM